MSRIAEVREELGELRDQVANLGHVMNREQRELTAAESRKLDTLTKQIRGNERELEQLATVADLGPGGPPSTRTRGDGTGRAPAGEQRAGMSAENDGWLSEVRSLTHGDGAFGTAITPPEIASQVFTLLERDSITLQAGIPVIPVGASELWIPRIEADPTTAWVAELEQIPDSQPDGDHLLIRPRKVATLAKLSREVWEDGEPLGLQAAQASIQRALARSIDQAFVKGTGTGEQPLGLLNTAGTTTVASVGAIDNLDAFAEAIALLTASNARATAIIIGAREFSTLLHLKRSSTAGTGDDNSPLLADPVAGTAAAGSIFGVPVYVSPDLAPAGGGAAQALVIDATQLAVVRRQDIQLDVDQSILFDRDGVAIRATARIDFAVPFPQAVVKLTGITLPTP